MSPTGRVAMLVHRTRVLYVNHCLRDRRAALGLPGMRQHGQVRAVTAIAIQTGGQTRRPTVDELADLKALYETISRVGEG